MCTGVNEFLRVLMSRLPLWGCVLNSYFNSESSVGVSNDVEAQFSLLKNNVFKNTRLPTCIDIFVKKWIFEVKAVSTLSSILLPKYVVSIMKLYLTVKYSLYLFI